MSRNLQRVLIAVPIVILCVAATQYAVNGHHAPTGSRGYLGTELAGVEAIRGNAAQALKATGGNIQVSLAEQTVGISVTGEVPTGLEATGIAYGVVGRATSAYAGLGVRGTGPTGVEGIAVPATGVGVNGYSGDGFGVRGTTINGTGVLGLIDEAGTGHAGYFMGRVHVAGTLTKSGGAFKIDHPLDPEGKYLSHSFVESPDMKNIYDGVIALDADGAAVVELPEWFDVLNKDFRYQLTCIGGHADVFIAEEINQNRFRIGGGYPGLKVSWQVTGIRDDVYARAYRIQVEEVKSVKEFGKFMHPELYRPAVPGAAVHK